MGKIKGELMQLESDISNAQESLEKVLNIKLDDTDTNIDELEKLTKEDDKLIEISKIAFSEVQVSCLVRSSLTESEYWKIVPVIAIKKKS